MTTRRLITMLGTAAAASALVFAMPVPAHADASAKGASSDANGLAAGWTADASYEGLCVPALLCPVVASAAAPGGVGGDGYLQTTFTAAADTVAGVSTGIWNSPNFTYTGVNGKKPASVAFDLSQLRNLGALLGLSVENSSSYSVQLVDTTNGAKIDVAGGSLTPNTSWSSIPTAAVSPDVLTVGRAYSLQIKSRYSAVVSAVATGEVGYDDAKLTSTSSDGSTTTINITENTTTTVNNNGDGSNKGSGITTRKELRELTKTFILPKTARLRGNNIVLKLRCPGKAAPLPCKIQVEGLSAGKFSKPATARKFVSLKPAKTKKAKVRVKAAYRTSYKSAAQAKRKIWVKSTVRVGKIRVTVRKKMALR